MNRSRKPDQIFIKLVDRYLDRVYRYLRNFTRNEDTARDLCHETFLSLRKQVDRDTEITEAYVFTTARNTALSQWRRDRREDDKREAWGRDRTATDSNRPSSSVENQEIGQALQTALQLLSEDQRTVFLLSEVEGLKYEQIALVLGISAGTVASRKFKAVRVLRGELKRMGHELP